MMKTSQSPSDVPSKQVKTASDLPIKQPPALQPGEKPEAEAKAAKPLKKSKKRPEKRPFGSIRCRSCNRYGLTEQCCCTPGARYSVMIQSKRVSKEQRKQIRRLSFATVKEAEEFRQLIAKRSYRTPDELCLNFFGFDPFRVQNHSFPMYESRQQLFPMPSPLQGAGWAQQMSNGRENAFMQQMQMQRASSFGNNLKRPIDSDLEFKLPKQMQQSSFGNNEKRSIDSDMKFQPPKQMQRTSFGNNLNRPFGSNMEFQSPKQMQDTPFGNNKKRRFDSDLELQPPKQRQRMGLSQFSPMGASSTKMRSLLAQSWQQVARSARPMSRLFPATMEPAGTHSSNHMSAAPTTVMGSPTGPLTGSLTGSPRSTCDSPHSLGDSPLVSKGYYDERQIKNLMLDVVSNCLSQRSLPLRSNDYHSLFATSK